MLWDSSRYVFDMHFVWCIRILRSPELPRGTTIFGSAPQWWADTVVGRHTVGETSVWIRMNICVVRLYGYFGALLE